MSRRIVEAVIENFGTKEERRYGHYALGLLVYSHTFRHSHDVYTLSEKTSQFHRPQKIYRITPAKLDEIMDSSKERLCVLSANLRRYNRLVQEITRKSP